MSDDSPAERGKRIKAAIKGTTLTQEDFGRLAEISLAQIGRYCAGWDVPEDQLSKIAKLTSTTCAWLRYGLVTSGQATFDRFVEGFELGRDTTVEIVERAIGEAKGEKAPRLADTGADHTTSSLDDREVGRGGVPVLGKQLRKKPRRA